MFPLAAMFQICSSVIFLKFRVMNAGKNIFLLEKSIMTLLVEYYSSLNFLVLNNSSSSNISFCILSTSLRRDCLFYFVSQLMKANYCRLIFFIVLELKSVDLIYCVIKLQIINFSRISQILKSFDQYQYLLSADPLKNL